MEKFLNKNVIVAYFTGHLAASYKGVITSIDDEFVCFDDNLYIAKKFIISIMVK